ncbi:MAG: sugar phosphate isomerase/epimerase family protein [Oscillospiraceae bacterium]
MGLLKDFSIQLYSLREQTATDFRGVLNKLSAIGYGGVEFAGYGDIPAPEMKELLQKLNIRPVGSHVGIDRFRENFAGEIDYARTVGIEYLIVPGYNVAETGTAAFVKEMKELAPRVKAEGFRFGYHNHDFEFKMDGDKYILDRLMDATAADELDIELDIFWAAYAGVDYLEYLKKWGSRIKLLHIKQIADFESKRCVDLDEGVIDFAEIITTGNAVGVKEYILEQEEFEIDPWISVEKGYKHIMSL